MEVKLISYSKPAISTEEEVFCNDVQDLISYCARVSNPNNQSNTETSERLIRYLAKHKHWSPFEMASACIEITTTRDIARQILRHRSFSFQEFSQRYADPTAELDDAFVLRECRLQDTSNRQNSVELVLDNPQSRNLATGWERAQQRVLYAVREAYQWAIDNGVAKEQARVVLPEGMTVSRLYMNGTIRSWIHFCQIRMDRSTQKEHREVAYACALEIAKIFPNMMEMIENAE